MEKKTVTLNRTSIYYELYKNEHNPQAKTIVLLHGFLSSSFSYRRLIPYLKGHFHVLVLDIPPFGESGKAPQFLYSYGNIAKTIVQLLQTFLLENCVLIGHSMGGQIALYAAKQCPSLISELILLCSSAYLPKAKKSLVLATYLPFSTFWIKKKLSDQGVHKNVYLCVHDESIVDEEMIKGYEKPFMDNRIYRAIKLLARHREGDLSKEQLARIHTPTLLLWGKHDRVVPLNRGIQLQKDLPNAFLKVYENAGHLLPEEKPSEVAEDIMEFLEERQTQ